MARILVINEDFRTVAASEILVAAGYEVHTQWSLADRLSDAQPVALVILPVFVPGKDHLHTLRDLRRHFANVPIITLSGRTSSEQDTRLLEQLGATRVVDCPVQPNKLLALVAASLRRDVS